MSALCQKRTRCDAAKKSSFLAAILLWQLSGLFQTRFERGEKGDCLRSCRRRTTPNRGRHYRVSWEEAPLKAHCVGQVCPLSLLDQGYGGRTRQAAAADRARAELSSQLSTLSLARAR